MSTIIVNLIFYLPTKENLQAGNPFAHILSLFLFQFQLQQLRAVIHILKLICMFAIACICRVFSYDQLCFPLLLSTNIYKLCLI